MPVNIPVIDLSECGLLVPDETSVSEDTFASMGKKLYDALSATGFAYLKNHGIPPERIEEANKIAKTFFSLSDEQKKKFSGKSFHFAYDPLYTTRADKKHSDYNEGIRMTGSAFEDDTLQWPDIPEFRATCVGLAESFKLLMFRMLKALGMGMKLKDSDYWIKSHSLVGKKGNASTLKFLHYPPVVNNEVLQDNATRIGKHTDFNTLIFLLQDSNGGLQVETEDGVFQDIPPVPGAIVLNCGDTFESWSRRRLVAAVHRVVPPSDPEKRKNTRRSIIYFGQADDDFLMEPLQFVDGTIDASPRDGKILTAGQYIKKRFAEHFY